MQSQYDNKITTTVNDAIELYEADNIGLMGENFSAFRDSI